MAAVQQMMAQTQAGGPPSRPIEMAPDPGGEPSGTARLERTQSTLAPALADPAAIEIGKTRRDKHPRPEGVKAK